MAGANFGTQPPTNPPGVTMSGGGGSPPRTDEQLVGILIQSLNDVKVRDIDITRVLADAGVPVLLNANVPTIDARRRGLRIIGNAYDVARILEAVKRAMEYFEQNGGDLTSSMTIVVHAPQDDEP